MQDKMESDTLLEGRAALFSVEVEKKIMSKIEKFQAELITAQRDYSQKSAVVTEKMQQMI